MEIWKQINDNRVLPHYEVSNYGRIRNSKTSRILRTKYKRGYLNIGIPGKNLVIHLQVHRVVLSTFSPIKNPEGYQVNHINHIRDDNRLENLEWVTLQQNSDKRHEVINIYKVEHVLNQYFNDELVNRIITEIRGL